MPRSDKPPDQSSRLRRRAEELLRQRPDVDWKIKNDVLELIYELEIHQAELEIQNEELRRAQQELSALHSEYVDLYEFAPCGYVTLDSKGIITRCNLTGVTLLRCEKKRIKGTGLSSFVMPEGRDDYWAALKRAESSGEKQSVELKLIGAGKEPRWVLADIRADRTESGVTSQWRLALVDIAEKKQAAEALREIEERWQFALEGAGDGVWDWNPQTDEVLYSRQWKAMLGFEEQEIGNALSEWDRRVHPEDRPRVSEEISKHFSGKTDVYVSEHRLECKDGSYKWILDRGKVIRWTENGLPLRVIGTHTDIHERKKAEAERIQLEQRLQQARKVESLGRMAGAIAHSFNNMLGAAIGNLEMALDDVPQGAVLETYLNEAMGASVQAARISRFMLTYLGQTGGKMELIDSAGAVREACSLLSPSLPANVRVKAELPPLGPLVEADGAHLTQILINLITNAAEAVGERAGEVAVTLEVVPGTGIGELQLLPVGWEPRAGEYACLSITDTGCGIDPENLDRIFDPFFSTKFAGRGLGLAVVSGLMRTLEGAIAVESHPGRGSTFKLFFPVSRQERPASQTDGILLTPSAIAGGGLVLVVDDEAMVRSMAESMLTRKFGYEVVTACGGVEALEIFSARKDEICLVLLDLSMPGMNGWETLSALRAIRPDTPVILASGYDETQVMCSEHAERPQAFLHKPFGANDLKSALVAAQRM